jgi:hypothetical protein
LQILQRKRRRSIIEEAGILWPNLQAGDKGWEPWNRHLLPIFEEIEALFIKCTCGGSFRYMNPPRCPKCNEFLDGHGYEDKPILRERSKYVFVSVDSIDDVDAIKSGAPDEKSA